MTPAAWFSVQDIAVDTWVIEEQLSDENCRSFIVAGTRAVAVLDTGTGVGDFARLAASLSNRDPIVLQSHAHWDHIGASHAYQRVLVHPSEAETLRRGVPNSDYRTVYTPAARARLPFPPGFDVETAFIPGVEPRGALCHGDSIERGGRTLEAFHTPGHSPGGITLLDRANRLLFPGDAVNLGNIYLQFEGGDPAAWRRSIELLADLAEHVDAIYPTHDSAPLTAADMRAIRDAYEDVWSGARQPTEQRADDDGPADVFDCGRYRFWLQPGTYGA